MIKAEEINRWIENANSFCYKRETCKGCPLVGEAEHGDYCRWEAGDMTQEQVDMITAYEPYVDWSNVPVDTKVVVWNDGDVEHRQYFAKYDDGRICTYLDGATSWSRESGLLVRWKYGRLAEDDE